MLPPNCKEEHTRKRLQDYTLFQTTEASSWGTWNSLAGEFYHRKEEVIFTFEVGFWRVLLLIGWPSLARSFHTIQKVWEKPSSSKRTNTPSTSTSWDNHRCPTMLQSTAEHKANWGTTFPLWTKQPASLWCEKNQFPIHLLLLLYTSGFPRPFVSTKPNG